MVKRFLVFGAHSDDVDFGCAGTIAKLTGEGNEVTYCIVTNGEKGIHKVNKPKSEMIKLRQKEQERAAKIVGVRKVIFLNEKDGEIEHTKLLKKKLVKVIREVRPDITLSFDPANAAFDNFYRYHHDHRVVAEAVFDALYPAAGSRAFFPELKKKPHNIQEAWFYASSHANLWIDITKTIQKKIAALSIHKTQVVDEKRIKKMVFARAGKTGKQRKMKYAESFRRLKLYNKK